MTAPKSYNNENYRNLLCSYINTLYDSLPPTLRSELDGARQNFCGEDIGSGSEDSGNSLEQWLLSRIPLTIPQAKDILADPWFAWDMDNDCSIVESVLVDIFGEGHSVPNPRVINPVIETSSYTSEELDFLKELGGFIHYLFARTYYIDRCYGTTAYLNYYYGGSLQNFYDAHTEDFSAYVDSTGLIKGDILLLAWQDDVDFRDSIVTLSFIKPLAGIFCSDFWNWTNANIYWWTQERLWPGSWTDDLIIQDGWYDSTSAMTLGINASAMITALGSEPFPGYRVSINDIYNTITLPESDALALLFGNNLLKGPTLIQELSSSLYPEDCAIPPPPSPTPTVTPTQTETPTVTPTSVTPTVTPTITPTSITSTPTSTPAPSSTPTSTPTSTAYETVTPTLTQSATATVTPTQTVTSTETPTQTATSTVTPTQTPTKTPTPSPVYSYELCVTNHNGILDDSWNVYLNGVFILNYDGQPSTDICEDIGSPALVSGQNTISFSLVTSNFSGNAFTVTVREKNTQQIIVSQVVSDGLPSVTVTFNI